MRISSLQVFNIADNSMARMNQAMVNTQEQMSTGRRVLTPADDPVAATKILQITQELASIGQYRNNIDIAKNNLVLEESTLSTVNNLIQRAQELAVQAANTATLSESEYTILASEVDEQLKELVNLVNTKNANGDYIFGGYKTSGLPFVGDANSGFRYNGDEGQQFIKIANSTIIAATDSGKAAFLDIKSEKVTVNTYPSSANISKPPVQISVGRVVDSDIYEEFYPEDLVITFNPDTNLQPPTKNFTVTERSSGRTIVENQTFSPGEEVIIQGVSVRFSGSPASGIAAIPATRPLGVDSIINFPTVIAAPGETFTAEVAGRKETFQLQGTFNNANDLTLAMNDVANGNADRLSRLRLTFDNQGFAQTDGVNFTVANGSAAVSNMMGIDSQNRSVSTNGATEVAGDRLFVDSSEKESILTTFARFGEAMSSYDGTQESREALSETIADTLNNLDNAQTSILNVVASVGARMNTLDNTEAFHIDAALVNQDVLSDIRDLDYAEAATRLSQQTLILQASQQSFIRVSQLTLFSQL